MQFPYQGNQNIPLSRFTIVCYCSASLVDVLVDRVQAGGRRAVDAARPVADEVPLVEECPPGAEERVRAAVQLAHVEHLREVKRVHRGQRKPRLQKALQNSSFRC